MQDDYEFSNTEDLNLPGFIALESGEGDVPVAIAWTLSDGRIKHTLIQPDEAWLEDDVASLGDYHADELLTMGVSVSDVIRELEADYHGSLLYSANPEQDEAALARIFEAISGSAFVSIVDAGTLYNDPDEWHQQRSEMFNEMGLEPGRAEHDLETLLKLHVRWLDDDMLAE